MSSVIKHALKYTAQVVITQSLCTRVHNRDHKFTQAKVASVSSASDDSIDSRVLDFSTQFAQAEINRPHVNYSRKYGIICLTKCAIVLLQF